MSSGLYSLCIILFGFLLFSNNICASRYNIHISIKDPAPEEENNNKIESNEPFHAESELESAQDFFSRLKLSRTPQQAVPSNDHISIPHRIGSHGPVDLPSNKSPWFCRDKDCPPYQSLNDTNLFETRIYNANLSFVVYKEEGRSLEMAQLRGIKRIYKYTSGENDQGIKLSMTTPVITTVGVGLSRNNYTVSYFVPFALQDSTPLPNDKSLFVYRAPYQIKLAVRGFSGYATSDKTLDELGILQKLLNEAGVKYSYHYWLVAVYDRPQRLSNRHNEVALILLE